MRFSRAVVKHRVAIVIITVLLLIPSVLGMAGTRINYDMLNYLPEDMDTVIGQNELLDDFGKGAFSLLIVEDMTPKEVSALKEKIEGVEHVESVIWYDSLMDVSVPMELLPDKIYNEFNTSDATMMAVFFDSATSADVTMDAIREIRSIAGKQCFVSGMSALVTDLKDLCEKEEPIYVGIAVALACVAMIVLLDSFLVPFVFLASIGAMILINLGSNYFFGEISYITKALSAVLQLAVTMDYSIFLWHSYNEQITHYDDHKQAMAAAIHETLVSVVGSSLTTVAGFIALCFMSFTLGRDLGIVMAKGVLFGVIGCVTVLPSLILMLDKPLQKTKHKSLIPNMDKAAGGIVKIFPVFLIIFVILMPIAIYGNNKTNDEVYYDMGQCLPEDMEYVIANTKLSEEFDIASTHMVLVDASVSPKDVRSMTKEMEEVPGIKYVLGLESVVGAQVPEEMLPDSIVSILKSDKWELLLINSEYKVASDEVNEQIDSLNTILKKYDPTGMLIGEAPCMKDMIETTNHDFQVVNAVSHRCHLYHYFNRGKEYFPAGYPDCGYRACRIHQLGSGALYGSVAAVYRSYLYQHHPVRCNRRLCDFDDHPLQSGKIIRKDQKAGCFHSAGYGNSFHYCQWYGTVLRHLRRSGLFRYRYYQLHVYADGKRRHYQYALRYLYSAGTADAL